MEQETHVSPAISGLIMLAAIFTTYTTYSYYNEDKLVQNYEEDQASMEQAASVIVSLRAMKAASAATSTATTTKETVVKAATPELQ